MNFVRLYIGDYMRDTGTLTVAEHGAYMLMLMHYYATEKPLPTGRDLHRLLRAESKADRDAIDGIVDRHWTRTDDGLVNGRADREIARAERQREVNRETGKLGGRPKRTETESVSESEPNDKRTQTLTRHQTPDTIKKQRQDPPTPLLAGAKRRPRRDEPQALPPWVDPQAWADFASMRQAIRKPLTAAAQRLAVAELAKLRDSGDDPTDVLRQSTFRSWAGLFPIKRANGSHAPEAEAKFAGAR